MLLLWSVSFDFEWQRRASGNSSASLSGHGFLIGVHTRRIIACVVFSKKCAICDTTIKPCTLYSNRRITTVITTVTPTSHNSTTSNDTPSAPPIFTTTLPPICNIDLQTLPSLSDLVRIDHTTKNLSSLDDPTITPESGIIDTSAMDHQCTRNYNGSSGAMENDGLVLKTRPRGEKYWWPIIPIYR